jgi:alkylated DNA nucleotide flippase Atl1
VVNSDGRLGGYAGQTSEKINRLKAEGVTIKNERVVHFKEKNYTFDA